MKFEVTFFINDPLRWFNREETIIIENASDKEDAVNQANNKLNAQGIIHGQVVDVRECHG